MKKQKRLTAAILTISMLLSNVAYAEELIDTKAVLDKIHSTISYSSDKIKNIASNIFNINSESGFSFENVEKDFIDPGVELDIRDMQALYDMGYEPSDIEMAVELAPIYNKTPYELLKLKGQKKYIPNEVIRPQSADNIVDSDIIENDSIESKDYNFTVEESSWDNILMGLNKDNTTINENQWEFIKLSGIDQLIDEEMLSEEDKLELEDTTINTLSTYTQSSSISTIDMYNNYIFPKSVFEQINQGGYNNSDDISVNELTGNNFIKATDINLPGRNGLDLNLTRYYSVANANNYDATVSKDASGSNIETKNYYAVCGNPKVTIYYNEPLSDGSTQTTSIINGVYIAPGRTNYNKKPNYTYGMFVSADAYDEDFEKLKSGIEPSYMFSNESTAKQCISYAENGYFNYTINFNTGGKSKIRKIEYDATDSGSFNVINVGRYTVTSDTSTYSNDIDDSSFSKYFDIGTGWAFDFPYIEKRYDANAKEIYEYLHMGSNGVWQIEDNSLVDYYLKDIQLSSGNGKFNEEYIDYILTEKSWKKYYFGSVGQLLGIEDRYKNKILFSYDKIRDGKLYYPKLKQITDSVGRIIDIKYQSSQVIITVTDKNDPSQNRTIEYNKTGIGQNNMVLSSVKNAEGYITKYDYTDQKCKVSMVSKDIDKTPSNINYKLLTTISYPTGMKTDLKYNTMKKNCGLGGVMEVPVFISKQIYSGEENVASTLKSTEAYGRDQGNNNYSSVYDGYPTFRNIKEVPDEYRVYSYTRKKLYKHAHEERTHSIYKKSYNGNWLKESVYDEYDDTPSESEPGHTYDTFTDYEYNNQELLTKETTKIYNDFKNDNKKYVETSKEYTYDNGKYGDVLSERINNDSNYTTYYTYDSTFHIPIKISKKKDSSTTIITNYTLTSDKSSIETMTVTENNSTKKKRAYVYDDYGNIITEKRYIGNNNWSDFVEVSYDYNDLRSVTNKLDGVYLNKISVSGIKDIDGNLVSGSTAGTVSKSYQYDWYGNIISETDANGQTYQYTYDSLNRVTKVTNPNSSTTEYTFTVDDNTNDVMVKDANGNVIKYSYDNFGEEKSITDVTNNILLSDVKENYEAGNYYQVYESTQYSTQNGCIKTQVGYNGLGEIIDKKILDADNKILRHESIWTEHAVDDMLTKTTTLVYGDTDAENVKNIKYTDIYGNIVKEETVYNENDTEKAATTTYTYDYLGNIKTIREPRAADENWSSNQYTTQYDYDVDGNVIKETDINGKSITNTYDGLGNLISVKDKNGNITTNTYDNLGRLLQEQIPFQKNGTSTVYSTNKYYYDSNGNLTKSQTANNAVGESVSYTTTEYQYNWQNQPTKVRGFDGNNVESCVQYYYDSVGNILRMYTGDVDNLVISGLDKVSGSNDYAVTKYEYDNMNRCTTQTDALGQKVNNTYDINGNLIETVDRNGNILSYTYDELNQLTRKSSSKTTNDTYTYAYNKKGLRTSMIGSDVNTTYVYNNLGQLAKEDLTDGTVKEYNYDMNGNRKSFTLTKDDIVQYTLTYDYDKLNQLTTVYENGDVKAEYTYNPDGTLKKSSYGNQTTDYSYNLANMLTEVNNANGSTQISKYTYTYYVDGNQKSKTESVAGTNKGTTNYTYDGLNRLVSEQAPDKTYSYQYDSYGNRSQLSVTGDETYTTSYTYDKNNRMRNQTKTAGTAKEITDFWYDPNGNQISSMTVSTGGTGTAGVGIALVGADNTNSYSEYNSWNQLTRTMQNGKTSSYTYNGDGLRMSKTINGVKTSHIWDGTNIAADVSGSTVTKYIRGLQLISSKKGSNENFYTYNGHGDVVQLTNGTGAITKQYSYDAFGVETDKADNDTNPFRYCGEYYDTETDSIYLRARYYRPTAGRFITEDPIRDGLNWYSYCRNNPIIFIDPLGLVSVGLRDYAGTYSGSSVEWDESTRTATVSWNDKSFSVLSDSKNNVDGRIQVDDSLFIQEFGIGDEQMVVYTDSVTGNSSIRVNFNITDNTNTTINNMTYADAFLNGVSNDWSSTTVACHTGQHANGIVVNINNVTTANDYSRSYLGGPINMFVGDGRTGYTYSLADFMSTSAHEFGHAGFHVYDIYHYTDPNTGSTKRTDPNISVPFKSIMNYQFGLGGAQPVDYDIIFTNKTWTLNSWFYYSSDSNTLDKHIGAGNW